MNMGLFDELRLAECHFEEVMAIVESMHSFSSTQVNMPAGAAGAIMEFASKIPDTEIYEDPEDDSFGREKCPHITVKYGLHTDDPAPVENVVRNNGEVHAVLGRISLFESDKYDVVKIEVESPALHKLNKLIAGCTEVTDTFPEYIPHSTIAYVKKGEGAKYVGDMTFDGVVVAFGEIHFSGKSGGVTSIDMTVKGDVVDKSRLRGGPMYTEDKCPACGSTNIMGTRGMTSDRRCADCDQWWHYLDGKQVLGQASKMYPIRYVTESEMLIETCRRYVLMLTERSIHLSESECLAESKSGKSGLQKFHEKHGIVPQTGSIGFSEKEQKWYGWSHRAIHGFKVGDVVEKGDCHAKDPDAEVGPSDGRGMEIGFVAKTLEDAKKMAIEFQDSVS